MVRGPLLLPCFFTSAFNVSAVNMGMSPAMTSTSPPSPFNTSSADRMACAVPSRSSFTTKQAPSPTFFFTSSAPLPITTTGLSEPAALAASIA